MKSIERRQPGVNLRATALWPRRAVWSLPAAHAVSSTEPGVYLEVEAARPVCRPINHGARSERCQPVHAVTTTPGVVCGNDRSRSLAVSL